MLKKIVIADHQVGFLIKGEQLKDILRADTYWRFDPFLKERVEYFDMREPLLISDWADIAVKQFPARMEALVDVVKTGADEAALISVDGKPAVRMHPFETAYVFKTFAPVSVERFDMAASHKTTKAVADRFDRALVLARADEARQGRVRLKAALVFDKTIERFTVRAHETGLAFVDGVLAEVLAPGEHAFWAVGRSVQVKTLDMRPVPLEMTAQEILTKDKVSLRLTLTSFVTVTDAAKAATATPDYEQHIYRLVQFAVREAIAGRTLADVLAGRDAVDAQIAETLGKTLGDIGVRVERLGIRDIILPGDMRELMNRVVEAEKLAEANIIRRREETAATRSLLNTAKLMDGNPMLLRLKELEALERVTEKIGRIDVHASEGKGLNTLLDGLVSIKERETQ